MGKPIYCAVCRERLRWYHKRTEFTFTDLIPTPDKKDAIPYTWIEVVCSACYKE